jgi:WD40 repeat protein
LYDYQTYLTKVITEKDLDFKSIKKVEIVADDSLCIAMSDGPMKIFDIQQWAIIKTIKGYHTKTVNWMLPYKQNENERPRIIAVSGDSLMACWNVDLATATI